MSSPTLDQLDGVLGDFGIKAPCRVASTAGITLSGLQTIDGVALAISDRVLVTGQSDTTLNGIYLADTATWALSLDFNSPTNVTRGTLVYVTDGSTNGNTLWHIVATNPVKPQDPSSPSAITITKISFTGTPGGSANQLQYNAAGSFGGFTLSGDATLVPSTGVITLAGGAVAHLNAAVGDSGAGVTKGLVPAASTGNATTAFLRKDMTYAVPAGASAPVAGALNISGGNAPWDWSAIQVATIAVNVNATVSNPTNKSVGTFILIATQSGGSNTLAFGTDYKFISTPTLTAANGKVDVFTFVYDGTTVRGTYSQNFAS